MPKPDTQVEETVLDEAAVKAIADQVALGMASTIAETVEKAVENFEDIAISTGSDYKKREV